MTNSGRCSPSTQSTHPPQSRRVTVADLGRRALLLGVRIESAWHADKFTDSQPGAWLTGPTAEEQANAVLRSLVVLGLPWEWSLGVEYHLEDGTHQTIQTTWPSLRGSPTVQDLLVVHYARIVKNTTAPRATRAEARRIAELLMGDLLPVHRATLQIRRGNPP